MRSLVAAVVVAGSLLSGCAGLQPQPGTSVRPPLPVAFDPPLAGTRASIQPRWWKELNDAQLDALVARALASNFDLQTAVARIAEARALVAIVDARAAPRLGLGGGAGYARIERQGSDGFLAANSPSRLDERHLALDAAWEIDVFGAVARRQDAARAELDAAIAQSGAVAVTVSGEVTAAYVELRAAQGMQVALRERIAIAADVEQLVAARVRAGMATEFDRLRAIAERGIAASELPQALAREELAARQLGVLVAGSSQALLPELALPRPLPTTLPPLPSAVPGMLLERRPDVIVAERRWTAALARVAGAEADRLPRITLGAVLGLVSISGGNLFSIAGGSWGVATMAAMLRLPLYAPELAAALEAERARAEEAALAYQRAAAVAILDVEAAGVRLARSREREGGLRVACAADDEALRVARVRYERGLTDFLAVLDAMRSRSTLERQWIDARAETIVQYVALSKALGGGWESPVAPEHGTASLP